MLAPVPPPALAVRFVNPVIVDAPPAVADVVPPDALLNVSAALEPELPQVTVTDAAAVSFASICNVPPTPPWA